MGSTNYILDSLMELDRHAARLSGAHDADEVTEVVRSYLAQWPAERIARVQSVDAGWAPFDDRLQPVPVLGPSDVRQICESVHDQCVALKAVGIPPTPELLELDLFFFLARLKLEGPGPQFARRA
jgi:hypothetical protein